MHYGHGTPVFSMRSPERGSYLYEERDMIDVTRPKLWYDEQPNANKENFYFPNY